MASSSCCPPDAWPYATAPTDYAPLGTTSSLPNGCPIYTSAPTTNTTKAVIVLPEVFGWAGRLKGICDSLANEGFLAIMPDCHRGDTAAGKEDVLKWVATFPFDGCIRDDFTSLFAHLQSLNITDVSSLGFCWGAWAFAKANEQGFKFSSCVAAHPSVKLEEFSFGRDQTDMLSNMTCPSLFMVAGNDDELLREGGKYGDIVIGKGGEVVLFEDMSHGWMSRGDISDSSVQRDVEKGWGLALAFLKKHAALGN